jgi:hypothetical protein
MFPIFNILSIVLIFSIHVGFAQERVDRFGDATGGLNAFTVSIDQNLQQHLWMATSCVAAFVRYLRIVSRLIWSRVWLISRAK